MAQTTLTELSNQIEKRWAPIATKKLRENLLLGSMVNRDYIGAIAAQGDTVRVSQLTDFTGQLLTVGTNADAFTPETANMTHIDIKADKRAVASVEFASTAELQSQLSHDNPMVIDSMVFAINKQINAHLVSLIAPSVAPDHTITGVTDLNASQLNAVRLLAAQAKWPDMPGWYGLIDPSYYGDLLNAVTLTSSDYGASDAPLVGGKIGLKRFGFNLFEDNSKSVDTALFFHPAFMHLVMQTQIQFKVSDLHSNLKFATVMSADVIFGAKLSGQGSLMHITVTA